jgi:hypothetical protein
MQYSTRLLEATTLDTLLKSAPNIKNKSYSRWTVALLWLLTITGQQEQLPRPFLDDTSRARFIVTKRAGFCFVVL